MNQWRVTSGPEPRWGGFTMGFQCTGCGEGFLIFYEENKQPWLVPSCAKCTKQDPELEALADEFLGPKE